MNGLRSVEEQLADVLPAVRLLPATRRPLAQARGATLREPILARVDLPVFDNSAMDGFAVRFADVANAAPDAPVRLRVVADLPAGTSDDPALAPGQAARIMTGAPMPTAADAVVPFEDTADGLDGSLDSALVLRAPQAAGAHIRRRGEDAHEGDELLPSGVALGPLQLAAAAASGNPLLTVSHRPRVAVVSTGTELVEPGLALRHGQIPESNGELLAGLVEAAGGVVAIRRSVPDEGGELARLVAEATDGPDAVDAVILSGGVSAGAYEVVKTTLSATMTFTKVAMQPGKPQGFGRIRDTVLFGLPGNPVSVAVSFEVFVRPALLTMQGRTDVHRPVLRLPAASGWRTPSGRRQYLPVTVDRGDPGRWRVRPATAGGSHLAGSLAHADAYAIVPADVEAVAPGDIVDVMLIS